MEESRPRSFHDARPGRDRDAPATPLIAVTGSSGAPGLAFGMIRRSLRDRGARVVRLSPGTPAPADRIDGLVLAGGVHVGAERSGLVASSRTPRGFETRILRHGPWRGDDDPQEARDLLELELLIHAEHRRLPVLGICRGMQIMNVARGGTLVAARSLPGGTRHRRRILTRVPIEVERDSRLATILGATSLDVNALHEHCVGRLGRGLRLVARSRDGIPQALEDPDRSFFVGVQWHPEYLVGTRSKRRIFAALVAASRDRARGIGSAP